MLLLLLLISPFYNTTSPPGHTRINVSGARAIHTLRMDPRRGDLGQRRPEAGETGFGGKGAGSEGEGKSSQGTSMPSGAAASLKPSWTSPPKSASEKRTDLIERASSGLPSSVPVVSKGVEAPPCCDRLPTEDEDGERRKALRKEWPAKKPGSPPTASGSKPASKLAGQEPLPGGSGNGRAAAVPPPPSSPNSQKFSELAPEPA
mmetsp:Transcript_46195/g.121974  ORF Transcript_46195/g.121974 Transcript_46195/m.121974 type:complete len:204 (-) Transcript_46195:744-1355(-)